MKTPAWTSAIVAPLILLGCQGPQLSAILSTEVYQQRLAENFSVGMTLPQVQAKLDEMLISDRYRFVYPPSPDGSEVLIVRTYDPGGPWPQNGFIEWVDSTFVFGSSGGLERWGMYRDGVRLGFDGRVFEGPNRAAMGGDPHDKWFAMQPPPMDPLSGVTWVGGASPWIP
ncbi:MAG TPA: hypothetical protein PKC43_07370 [Phycisphaerales bacterium]|nr:hypothetical protein [Phycisphaerales bacterium]HMP37255.1 hypothetical protein [Phycisphaerales bacterium]